MELDVFGFGLAVCWREISKLIGGEMSGRCVVLM